MAQTVKQEGSVKRLKILRGSRAGKIGSITKRINQLEQYVEDRKGRRATELLLEYLLKVYGELETVSNEISYICDEYDSRNIFNIEDIRFEVEACAASVVEYLDDRKDDLPASNSSAELEWVKKHASLFGNENGESDSSDSGESEKLKHIESGTIPEDGPPKDEGNNFSDFYATVSAVSHAPFISKFPPPANSSQALDNYQHDGNIAGKTEMLCTGDEIMVENSEGRQECSGGNELNVCCEVKQTNGFAGGVERSKDAGKRSKLLLLSITHKSSINR